MTSGDSHTPTAETIAQWRDEADPDKPMGIPRTIRTGFDERDHRILVLCDALAGLLAGAADTDELIERMEALATEIETPMRCTDPAYGAPGFTHCAACCGMTGYVVTCAEDQAMLDAANALNHAVTLYRAAVGDTSHTPKEA